MDINQVCRAYTAQGIEKQISEEKVESLTKIATELKQLAEKQAGELLAAKNEAANKETLVLALKAENDQLRAKLAEKDIAETMGG